MSQAPASGGGTAPRGGPAPLRVMLVDDSAAIRRLLADTLAGDPEIEVCGTAGDGRSALGKLDMYKPDVVVLDIEMPHLDGIGTLKELRKTHPRLPVVMFSTLTERGAAATLDALAAGANDYVTKPSNTGSFDVARQRVRETLVPKIKALCRRGSFTPPLQSLAATNTWKPPAARMGLPPRVDIVAIGVSTGGPAALDIVLPQLRGDFPVPIVLVQHMPPLFTKMLAERLSSKSRIKVVEAVDGQPLARGVCHVAPGDWHMTLKQDGALVRVALDQNPPENSCRPAVDPLLRSVAQVYGANSLSVILTGMGQDGLKGCEATRRAGGFVFAQDEPTSVVWGMPGFVSRSGLADKVLPLQQVAAEIEKRVLDRRAAAAAG